MKLRINNKTYAGIEEAMPELTEEFSTFIKEWFDDKPYVTAHTSGSTGKPKAIKLLKADMKASAELTNSFFNINSHSRLLLCLSPSYIAGKMMIVRWLLSGSELEVRKPTSSPLQAEEQHFHFAAMVPAQVKNILSSDATASRIDNIDSLIIGGAPIDETTEKLLAQTRVAAYATYGMTETMSHIALRKVGRDDEYFALGDVSFTQDERGCLVITLPHLSIKRVITNDMVRLNGSRHFKWLGRYDNVINSGGIKIIPEETEEVLRPYITSRFYIAGAPDSKWGEKPVLVIEGEPWSMDKQEALVAAIAQNTEPYKRPKEIRFYKQFKETASGKVVRMLPSEQQEGYIKDRVK